jgi:predicted O-linked N-acetylglucosamine transferase (SPINDLY family)/glycosyltransferase involved in cell wall biosynthesis
MIAPASDVQQTLEDAAQAAWLQGDYQRAIDLRQELRSLSPNLINNLLHLMLLSMHGEGLSIEQFQELDITTKLAAMQSDPGQVDEILVLQALEKFLQSPFLLMETAEFVAACAPFVPDAEKFVAVVFPPTTQLGYGRGWFGLAAALTDVCLDWLPNDLNLLMSLPIFCQKSGMYDRGVTAAQNLLAIVETDADRLIASYMLLRGLLNTGGAWHEAVAMLPAHRSRVASLIAAQPILSQLDSGRILPVTYMLPYMTDQPELNHRLQNQVIAVIERSMQTYGRTPYDRYQASHAARKTQAAPQKLKVGYICHCFHSHSVGWLARWLLRHHDASQIELYAYMVNPVEKQDAVQDEYRQIVPNLRACGIDGFEIAEQIYQDGIDILVDLDSLTLDVTCEVMALKPAPIQVTWLGWDASGVSTIDYYLADRYVLPENAQDYYVEEIWRLPSTYLAVDGFEVGEADLTRAQLDIPEDAVVFYSGQRGYKRHRDTVLWQLKIVAQVPKGILLVKGLADEDAVKAFFYELADEVSLDYNQLRFAPQADSEPIHRANLAMADIVLDTFPYNGATTTMEALWMERPLVTLVGEQFAARNSYTMLVNAGIEEGIAWSPEEYIEWGVRLGNDPDLRKTVMEKLRLSKTQAPLWNAKQFAQDVEVSYQQMAQLFWTEDETELEVKQLRIDRARQSLENLAPIGRAILVLIDWQQQEETLEALLYRFFHTMLAANPADRFLIDTTGIDQELADMMLGGALMNFLMMEEIEAEIEPNMLLVEPLTGASLDRFVDQYFHCAKLVCGVVEIESELMGRVTAIADYADHAGGLIQAIQQSGVGGKIIVDGVFFQLYNTGIGRLWQSLLIEWSNTEFSNNILVLDRDHTCPRIPGINYRVVPLCKYDELEAEQRFLQTICDEESADLFISTYYTRPQTTRSIFMGYDMIPEVLGADFSKPIWQAKHDAIRQAIAHITISKNTARDLKQHFPELNAEAVTPILCGVSEHFCPANQAEIAEFRHRYNIHKPYFLLVGPGLGYKNSQLFLEGLSQLCSRRGFDVVCTGSSGIGFSAEARRQLPDVLFHPLYLEDDELRLAYAGAVALVYPSKYEGFGLPVAEALKCGCPVITSANASIPEVAGDAAIYIGDRDAAAMAEALLQVQSPQIRQRLIQAGYQQAKKFSWVTMAEQMQVTLSAYLQLP